GRLQPRRVRGADASRCRRRRGLARTVAANAAAARRAPDVRGRIERSCGRQLRAFQYLSGRRRGAPASVWPPHMTLTELNRLPETRAQYELLRCCASHRWSHLMATERPFANVDVLAAAAQRLWWSLAVADWLEAFAAHPR